MSISFKSFGVFIAVTVLIGLGGLTTQAQTYNGASNTQLQSAISDLQQQVDSLSSEVRTNNERPGDPGGNPGDAGGDTGEDGDDGDASEDNENTESPINFELDDTLESGSRGQQVRWVQQLLSQHPDIYPEGIVSGYYGQITSQAVADLQRQAGFPPVGRLGQQTLDYLQEISDPVGQNQDDGGEDDPDDSGEAEACGLVRLSPGEESNISADEGTVSVQYIEERNGNYEVEFEGERRGFTGEGDTLTYDGETYRLDNAVSFSAEPTSPGGRSVDRPARGFIIITHRCDNPDDGEDPSDPGDGNGEQCEFVSLRDGQTDTIDLTTSGFEVRFIRGSSESGYTVSFDGNRVSFSGEGDTVSYEGEEFELADVREVRPPTNRLDPFRVAVIQHVCDESDDGNEENPGDEDPQPGQQCETVAGRDGQTRTMDLTTFGVEVEFLGGSTNGYSASFDGNRKTFSGEGDTVSYEGEEFELANLTQLTIPDIESRDIQNELEVQPDRTEPLTIAVIQHVCDESDDGGGEDPQDPRTISLRDTLRDTFSFVAEVTRVDSTTWEYRVQGEVPNPGYGMEILTDGPQIIANVRPGSGPVTQQVSPVNASGQFTTDDSADYEDIEFDVRLTGDTTENQAPDARDDRYAVTAGETLRVGSVRAGVLGNDSDPDGDEITTSQEMWTGTQNAANASIDTVASDGRFAISVDEDFPIGERLGYAYKVTDGDLSDSADVEISVSDPNESPESKPPVARLSLQRPTHVLSVNYQARSQNHDALLNVLDELRGVLVTNPEYDRGEIGLNVTRNPSGLFQTIAQQARDRVQGPGENIDGLDRVGNNLIYTGEEFTVDASRSSDPDTNNANLEYQWEVETPSGQRGGGSFGGRTQISTSFDDTGTAFFKVTVRDEDGNTDTDSIEFDVREDDRGQNQAPQARSDRYTVTAGETLDVSSPQNGLLGNDSDPDEGDQLRLENANRNSNYSGVSFGANPDGTFRLSVDEDYEGERVSYRYTITDGELEDSAGAVIEVEESEEPGQNNSPTALLELESESRPVEVGEQFTVDATGSSDPDTINSFLEYQWEVETPTGESGSSGFTDLSEISTSFDIAGTANFEVTVRDEDGNTDTDSVQFEVRDDTANPDLNLEVSPRRSNNEVGATANWDPIAEADSYRVTRFRRDVRGQAENTITTDENQTSASTGLYPNSAKDQGYCYTFRFTVEALDNGDPLAGTEETQEVCIMADESNEPGTPPEEYEPEQQQSDSQLILERTVGGIDEFPADEVLLGDVDQNGSITAGDAGLIQDYLRGEADLNFRQKAAADVDGDGEITGNDVQSTPTPIEPPIGEPTLPGPQL